MTAKELTRTSPMLYQQVRGAVVDDESLPWVPFAPFGQTVEIKYIKLDPIRGEMIALVRAPAGLLLPRHHHSGTVIVYTLKGRWKYREHNWIATKGSLVFEPAASRHTPEVLDGAGELMTLNIVAGDVVFLSEDDSVLAIENWRTGMDRYLAHCAGHGIVPRDLTAFA